MQLASGQRNTLDTLQLSSDGQFFISFFFGKKKRLFLNIYSGVYFLTGRFSTQSSSSGLPAA